jgi:hypothetical protein
MSVPPVSVRPFVARDEDLVGETLDRFPDAGGSQLRRRRILSRHDCLVKTGAPTDQTALQGDLP